MAPQKKKNQELNARREEHCFAITHERKFYHVGNTFIKRSLRPSEWQRKYNGGVHVPPFNAERILNEGACIQFLAEKTDIPVPKLYACFKDDGTVYLLMEYIEGVSMDKLGEEEQKFVAIELERYLETLERLKSDTWGGPDGMVLRPYRILRTSNGLRWQMQKREKHDLIFCHNDFSGHNGIVDPKTLKINAIVDWEYAGFYPPEFDAPFYRRLGPSVALEGEVDDVDALLKVMAAESE